LRVCFFVVAAVVLCVAKTYAAGVVPELRGLSSRSGESVYGGEFGEYGVGSAESDELKSDTVVASAGVDSVKQFVMPESLLNRKVRPKVALVLCGGGAKGAAHVGVLKALEQLEIPVDMIVGTSIGGLVGGLYSIGYTADELSGMFRSMDWDRILSNTTVRRDAFYKTKEEDQKYFLMVPFSTLRKGENKKLLSSGFVNGQNVYNVLNGYSGGYRDSMDFRQLPIEFACIATDLSNGEKVVLNHGSLPMAMRATMAIPGFFEAVTIDGKVLVDGGVVDNYPVDVARSMGADIIIGVDIQDKLFTAEQLNTLPNVVMQLIGLLGVEQYHKNLKDTDIYIQPDVSNYSTLSFNKQAIDSLLVIGDVAAKGVIPQLEALSKALKKYKVEPAKAEGKRTYHAIPIEKDVYYISNIKVNGIDPKDVEWLLNHGRLTDGIENFNHEDGSFKSTITGEDLNKAINRFYGTGAFSSINYTMKGDSPQYPDTLVIDFVEGPKHEAGVGVRYDTEEAAAVLLHLGMWSRQLFGSRVDLNVRLSYNPYVQVKYSYISKRIPKFNFEYKFNSTDVSIFDDSKTVGHLKFVRNKLAASLSNLYVRNWNIDLGIAFEAYNVLDWTTADPQQYSDPETVQEVNDGSVDIKGSWNYLLPYVKVTFDTRDSRYFTNKGIYFNADFSLPLGGIGANSGKSFPIFKADFVAAIRFSDRVCFIPRLTYRGYWSDDYYHIPYYNYAGGVEDGRYIDSQASFIGINNLEAFYSNMAILRGDLRVRMWKKHYAYAIANWMRTSNIFESMFNVDGRGYGGYGLKYEYNSKFGPLGLLVQYSTFTRNTGAYLSLGYFF